MRKQIAVSLTTGLVFLACADAALAQGFKFRPDKLDRADSYVHRRKLQIVDTNPEITDHRRTPAAQRTLIIKIPQLPKQAGSQVVVLDSGSGKPTTGIDLSKLPESRFQSNIPAGGVSQPGSLPNGHITIGRKSLAGQMRPARKTARPVARWPSVMSGGSPEVLRYDKKPGYAARSNTSIFKADVTGELQTPIKKRGHLLNKTK